MSDRTKKEFLTHNEIALIENIIRLSKHTKTKTIALSDSQLKMLHTAQNRVGYQIYSSLINGIEFVSTAQRRRNRKSDTANLFGVKV